MCRGWCCAWIQEVRKQAAEGKIICCAVSNIYNRDAWPTILRSELRGWMQTPAMPWHTLQSAEDWIEKYGAGSSELSDARAEEFHLQKRLGSANDGCFASLKLSF